MKMKEETSLSDKILTTIANMYLWAGIPLSALVIFALVNYWVH